MSVGSSTVETIASSFKWPNALFVRDHMLYIADSHPSERKLTRCSLSGQDCLVLSYETPDDRGALIIMAALWNRAGHYIFAPYFVLSSSFLFPRLISAEYRWRPLFNAAKFG